MGRLWLAFGAAAAIGLSGCGGAQQEAGVASLADRRTQIHEAIRNLDFVPLKLPRNDMGPGTIVEVINDPATGLAQAERYSTMATCGATAEELDTSPGTGVGLNANQSFDLDANLSLGVGEFKIAPNAEFVRSAELRIGESATPSLDRIKIELWRERIIRDYDTLGLPSICRDIANDTPRSLYIVYEALALTKGELVYKARDGAEAKVSQQIEELAELDASIAAVGESTIQFDGPIYFGVKRLAYLNGRPLGEAARRADQSAQADAGSATRSIGITIPKAELNNADIEAAFGPAL